MTGTWTPDGHPDTPYMRARQEWDTRMGSAIVHARNWRLATFVSLGATTFALGGMIYLGRLPKAVPHVIEVDRLGAATYRGPVGETQLRPVGRRHHVPPAAVHRRHARDLVGLRGPQAQLARRVRARDAARGQHALGVRPESRQRSVPSHA